MTLVSIDEFSIEPPDSRVLRDYLRLVQGELNALADDNGVVLDHVDRRVDSLSSALSGVQDTLTQVMERLDKHEHSTVSVPAPVAEPPAPVAEPPAPSPVVITGSST